MLKEDNYFSIIYEHIKNKAKDIYILQNKNKHGKYYGIFDYTFWRDKKTTFPDARFQEVLSTFVILNSVEPFHDKSKYFETIKSGLLGLEKIQNKNGSFDEWYKGENGLAATIYVGISLINILEYGKNNEKQINDLILIILKKIFNFVKNKNDLIKINHQAALIYLLVKIEQLQILKINEIIIKKIINKKIFLLFKNQREDGWFHEISGKDLGYSFLILDYLSLSYEIFPKLFNLEKIIKLYNNCISFLEANMTHDKRLSFCMNGYFSPISTLILSKYEKNADYTLQKLISNKKLNRSILFDYLIDELRFLRWSHMPLIAYKKYVENLKKKEIKVFDEVKKFEHISSDKSVISKYFGNYKVLSSPYNGGFFKILNSKDEEVLNFNSISLKKMKILSSGYKKRKVNIKSNSITFEVFLNKVKFFEPSNLLIFTITLFSNFYILSKIVRLIADKYRKIINTSLNQSDAPFITPFGTKYKGVNRIKIINDHLYLTYKFKKKVFKNFNVEISKKTNFNKIYFFKKNYYLCMKYNL